MNPIKKLTSDQKKFMMVVSGVLTPLLVLAALLYADFDVSRATTVVPIALIIGMAPYSIYSYLAFERLKKVEEGFPEFARGLAEAKRSGITLPTAIMNAAESEYGPLSVEVRKMAAQLSWGIPFPRVMQMFQQRMEGSSFIKRAVAITMEAYKSGGDVAEALDSVAFNARLLKDLETERKMKLSQQVVVMYVIFFIFMGMIIALHSILTPMFTMQAQSSGGGFGFGSGGGRTPDQYRTSFFHMVLIQGFFSGIIAGQLGEGSPIAGIKHSMFMIIASIVVFSVALPPVEITVTVQSALTSPRPGQNYEVVGLASYQDGKPVVNGDVKITFGEDLSFLTKTGSDGSINYRFDLPEAGVYTMEVTVIDDEDKKGSSSMEVTVK